jgi:hypothetical protein
MKLKKLLDVLSPLCGIVIWGKDEVNDEPLFEGYVDEVPYSLSKYPIYINANEDIDVRANDNSIIVTIDDTVGVKR